MLSPASPRVVALAAAPIPHAGIRNLLPIEGTRFGAAPGAPKLRQRTVATLLAPASLQLPERVMRLKAA